MILICDAATTILGSNGLPLLNRSSAKLPVLAQCAVCEAGNADGRAAGIGVGYLAFAPDRGLRRFAQSEKKAWLSFNSNAFRPLSVRM